jgi:O-succinylbenzoic acid--CoA ligase
MTSLWLTGKNFSFEEIKNTFKQNHNAFEESILNFCRDWLNGKTEFQIQTSGSTGNPKTISFTRAQLQASAKLTEEALQLRTGFNSLVCLDAKYIAGQMMLVRSLVTGMNIFAVAPTANPFQQIPNEIKIDFAALVPYQVQAILDSPYEYRFNEIKTIIIGGAPLPFSIQDRLQKFSCSFYATYGMTETISHIALQKLNGVDRQNFFVPLPLVRIKKDDRGCLVVTAPHVSGPEIITNDLVEINNDQSFKIIGRWDNVINSGGVKINPEKIEAAVGQAFSNCKIKNEYFITGMNDLKFGKTVNLIIEDEIWDETKKEMIESELKKALPKFELPKEIYFLKNFVRTASGKINRAATVNLLPVRF